MKTCCHSLSFVVPLVITRCTIHCHSFSFLVTCCTTCYCSLPLVAIRCATGLSFYQRSDTAVLGKTDVRSRTRFLQKSCSENFRKINGKTSTVECCDFTTKITLHLECFPVNFRTGFLQNASGQLLPNNEGSTKNQKNE